MAHKEKMNWLKENDPITYYEMTSNPCGVDSSPNDFSGNRIFIVILVVILILAVCLK